MTLSRTEVNKIVTQFYNGHNVDKYYSEGVGKTSNAKIYGKKRIKRISGVNFGTSSLISSVNVTQTFKNTILLNGRPSQVIQSKFFSQNDVCCISVSFKMNQI